MNGFWSYSQTPPTPPYLLINEAGDSLVVLSFKEAKLAAYNKLQVANLKDYAYQLENRIHRDTGTIKLLNVILDECERVSILRETALKQDEYLINNLRNSLRLSIDNNRRLRRRNRLLVVTGAIITTSLTILAIK